VVIVADALLNLGFGPFVAILFPLALEAGIQLLIDPCQFLLQMLLLLLHHAPNVAQIALNLGAINLDDDVVGEIDNLLQLAWRDVQQKPKWAGRLPLEIPDMHHRCSQLDMPHAFASHAGTGHLHAAPLAANALVLHTLITPAGTLPVAGRSEDALAEQAVALRAEGAIVDCFGLFDLPIRPRPNVLG
jgi:hypothetical protein